MKPVLCLQHVAAEGPGTIKEAVESRGGTLRLVRIFEREPVPRSLSEVGGLVVMGGPMGVYEARQYPHLDDELRLIGLGLEAQIPILGVCLGSQLLAAAAGARVSPSGGKEIGWYEVRLRPEAQGDLLFRGLDPAFTGFHWHGDIFTLPPGAVPLAQSQKTELQAFRVGSQAYGLLFHLEVTRPQVVEMVGLFGDELAQARIDPQTLLSGLDGKLEALRPIGTTVFGRWADRVLLR
jgi:GMP synthase (glutamine-hydrolysing)